MSSLYCSYNTRDKASCLYLNDCNNLNKQNHVQSPCPADFDNYEVLGCSKNNDSKSCPVMLCNYEKSATENSKIFSRNFPENKTPIIPNYRGSFKVCNKYVDKNDISKSNRTHDNRIIAVTSEQTNEFYPGKAPASIYFQNVDVESNLYRLGNNDSKCPEKRYSAPDCSEKISNNNPTLLSNTMCQNTRFFDFTHEDMIPEYQNKCGSISDDVNKLNRRTYTCEDQNTPYKTQSMVEFNYKKIKNMPCSTGCLARNKNHIDIPQPVPYSQTTGMLKQPVLLVGPERVNHKVENVWNNVTKRRYITKLYTQ
jgi:hypothetical protein